MRAANAPATLAGMRAGFVAAALGLVVLSSGCGGAKPPKTAADAPITERDPLAPPSWLPAYTSAQSALLAPPDLAIREPAFRTYPDLERFGYSGSRKMEDVREGLKFTKMVADVLEESPRYYVLGEAGPELANTIAQYGPPSPAEPDGFQIVERGEGGIGALAPADVAPEARRAFDEAVAKMRDGKAADAIPTLRAAAAKSPKVPAIKTALADAIAATGDAKAAEVAYRDALAVDPTYATAHRGLAELFAAQKDEAGARREIAEALAWYPTSAQVLASADRITGGAVARGTGRVKPWSSFIEVDRVGAIHVAASGGNPPSMYASCRAIMRYEPDVRSAIFQEPPDTPYYLSMLEEVVCLESAIGAYVFDHLDESSDKPDDPALEALLDLAKSEGLSGYAMFEILGAHRPERARTAPSDVHRAMVEYVTRHVLEVAPAPPPPGMYNASLSRPTRTL
jgi:hypothetical protein